MLTVQDLNIRFDAIIRNCRGIMSVTKRMTFFASGFAQAALVFPLAIVAPAYFAGRMTLGGIFQTANAFVKVQEALSWVVANYAKIAEWCATIERLDKFADDINTIHGRSIEKRSSIDNSNTLEATDLTLKRPDGRPLFRNITLRIDKGERVLLRGPSGIGKSTLLRAFAGLWPHYTGQMFMPNGIRMFVPQKPYIPTGSLLRALTYPLESDSVELASASNALELAGLQQYREYLHCEDLWSAKLSGGEIQRLALARILLQKPDWLFLDEATSHLDTAAEMDFYAKIIKALPTITVISVAHHDQVERFHSRAIEFKYNGIACDEQKDDM